MNKEIARRLKVYRIVRNITQEQMANDLKISRSKVSSWESNRRDMNITDAILVSKYLNISMDNLFNPEALSTDEFNKIATRYFQNSEISDFEKTETLKKLFKYKSDFEIEKLFNESK